MFDLEEQLRHWKKSFTRMDVMRSSDIEELEQHVRDSIATLTSRGLNQEEAFVLATHRVGAPGPLVREFAKVNGRHVWSQRVFWMTAGALGYIVCGLVIGAIASLSQVVVSLAGGSGAAVGYMAVGITCLGWVVLAALLYHRQTNDSRMFTNVSAGVLGSAVAIAVVVASGMSFGSKVVLGRLMPVPDLAWAQLISNGASIMATALTPLVLLTVMLLLGRQLRDTREADQ